MKLRIALWAGIGALVVVFWSLWISATTSTAHGIGWVLICLTCPVSLLGHHPLNFYVALLVNAATYALAGFLVETMRRRRRRAGPA